jgi:hypothetical protein
MDMQIEPLSQLIPQSVEREPVGGNVYNPTVASARDEDLPSRGREREDAKIMERVKRACAALLGWKQVKPTQGQRTYEDVLAESKRELAKGR